MPCRARDACTFPSCLIFLVKQREMRNNRDMHAVSNVGMSETLFDHDIEGHEDGLTSEWIKFRMTILWLHAFLPYTAKIKRRP